MKRLIFLTLATILLTGCAENGVKTTKNPGEPQCRIRGKEHTVYSGYGYQIIEIDGVEYVAPSTGGICPLVKDTLK